MIDNNAKRPGIPYFLLILLALMLLNSLLVPALTKEEVHEVDYNTFLTQLDEVKYKSPRRFY